MSEAPVINWIDKLSQVDMPVLSAVVLKLNELTGDDGTEVNQLAEVVLKDPHLTSQILRIANTVHYNASSSSINTVSRAIVLIGFKRVRSLCISLMVIDSLLRKEPKEQLLIVMAKAFHCAVQAREIYKQVGDPKRQEEVFISALLYNLGEMAFWAYGGQTADDLDNELQAYLSSDPNANPTDSGNHLAEKKLGLNFKALTQGLGKAWNLGSILQDSLAGTQAASTKDKVSSARVIQLANELSQLNQQDWDSKKKLALLRKVVTLTDLALSDVSHLVEASANSAASVALEYGAAKVCHLMPNNRQKSSQSKTPSKATILKADPSLQLKILRDLVSSVNEGVDVNTIFQMTLEGMHRGIGLERVALAFFQRDMIRGKYILGEETEHWRGKFTFSVASEATSTIFSANLHKPQPVWLDQTFIDSNTHLYAAPMLRLLGNAPCFIGILRINNRNATLFYADRGSTNADLTEEHFDAFKHFLAQAEISVQTIANKKKYQGA